MISDKRLIEKALQARKNSYSPYSRFMVGAVVLWSSGNIYTGCNIENSSFGATNCAERTAIFCGVSAGEVAKGGKITKVVVVGGKNDAQKLNFCTPCGICLQVISEFAAVECKIVLTEIKTTDDDYIIENTKEYSLSDLLPNGFCLGE